MSKLTKDNIVTVFNSIYEKVNNGIPKISPPVEEFADEYESHIKSRSVWINKWNKSRSGGLYQYHWRFNKKYYYGRRQKRSNEKKIDL